MSQHKKTEAPAENKTPHHCPTEHEGCGINFPYEGWNKAAMLCNTCARTLANKYGLAYESAGDAHMQNLIPYYVGKFPWLGNCSYRTKVRVLALAGGSTGVLNPTEKEIKAGAEIGEIVKKINPSKATNLERLAASIMQEMEPEGFFV